MRSPADVSHTIVRVVGRVQGREIDAPATLELQNQALVIVWTGAAPWRLALEGIDGISQELRRLTLYLSSGGVLEVTGDDGLRPFGAQLLDRACTMPELTRGLRALGSRRGTLGSAHDAWFAPLLSARRSVEGITDPIGQLALMNAGRLAESMTKVIASLAAVRAPIDAPLQRAIEAGLEEHAAPLFTALARMAIAANALEASASDTLLLEWRRWVVTVREVFAAADESWRKAAGEISPDE